MFVERATTRAFESSPIKSSILERMIDVNKIDSLEYTILYKMR